MARYDTIGHGYSRTRREDPRFGASLVPALPAARVDPMKVLREE